MENQIRGGGILGLGLEGEYYYLCHLWCRYDTYYWTFVFAAWHHFSARSNKLVFFSARNLKTQVFPLASSVWEFCLLVVILLHVANDSFHPYSSKEATAVG
eukprot:scaffold4095_cov117-Cylindrotheca_fusiformis.AAC.5